MRADEAGSAGDPDSLHVLLLPDGQRARVGRPVPSPSRPLVVVFDPGREGEAEGLAEGVVRRRASRGRPSISEPDLPRGAIASARRPGARAPGRSRDLGRRARGRRAPRGPSDRRTRMRSPGAVSRSIRERPVGGGLVAGGASAQRAPTRHARSARASLRSARRRRDETEPAAPRSATGLTAEQAEVELGQEDRDSGA